MYNVEWDQQITPDVLICVIVWIQTRYKLHHTWNPNRLQTTSDLKCKHTTNYIRQHTINHTKHWMQTHCKLHSGNTLQTTPDLKCKHTTNYIKQHTTNYILLHLECHLLMWHDVFLRIVQGFIVGCDMTHSSRSVIVSVVGCGMTHL